MRLALYQPEIPQNVGSILRLGACLNVGVDVIEPCGFVFSDRRMRRAGMDYIDAVDWQRHSSWENFCKASQGRRLILLTPHTAHLHSRFQFDTEDILLLGRESDGVPPEVAAQVVLHIRIPMQPQQRSLNVAMSAAIVVAAALHQTQSWPREVS